MSNISKNCLDKGLNDRIKNYCELKEIIPADGISAVFSEDICLEDFKEIIKDNDRFKWAENSTLKKKIDALQLKEVVYIIFTDNFPFTEESIEKKYEKLKEDKIAICRKNNENNATDSQILKWKNLEENQEYCLYVGGSSDFTSRLRQHLGYGPESTYSLQLKRWWSEAKIHIDVWDITDIVGEDSTKRQIIEDILWDKYDPLFGKQGAK